MTTLKILETGLQNSLCIIAIFMSMQDGMILYGFKERLQKTILRLSDSFLYISKCPETRLLTLNDWIAKPLYDCLYCMASFWSIIFWSIQFHRWSVDLLFVILVTSGFNIIMGNTVSNIVFNYHRHRTNDDN